jgi:hypothetical protein
MFTKPAVLTTLVFGCFAVSSAALGDVESKTLLTNSYQQSASISARAF